MEMNLTADQTTLWQHLMTLLNEQLIALSADVETTRTIGPAVMNALNQANVPVTGLASDHDGFTAQALSIMAIAQSSASIATLLGAWWQVADQIKAFGSRQQRRRHLRAPQLMGLATSPVNAQTVQVTAEKVEGGWQLTGYVDNVVNAGQASTYLIFAESAPDTLSAFLVAANQSGLEVTPPTSTLGLHGLVLAGINLNQVKVTAVQRLGKADQGLEIMQNSQVLGRIFMSATSAGIFHQASRQIQQLSLTDQPPLAQLAPLTTATRAIQLLTLDAAQQADHHVAFVSAATMAAFAATQQGTTLLATVAPLIGELAYSAHSPLVALQQDLQTLPLLTGSMNTLENALATATLAQQPVVMRPAHQTRQRATPRPEKPVSEVANPEPAHPVEDQTVAAKHISPKPIAPKPIESKRSATEAVVAKPTSTKATNSPAKSAAADQPKVQATNSIVTMPGSDSLAVSDLHWVVKRLNLTKDVPVNVGKITKAKRIVALGRGALDSDVLRSAQQLAKWIGAAVAVTEPLTALDQFTSDQQIDRQDVLVAPEVLINIGISGGDQFNASTAGAQHVLSVNVDGHAPIFKRSQEVFVGTAAEFVTGMIEALN